MQDRGGTGETPDASHPEVASAEGSGLSDALKPGQVIGECEILREIGRGGMGVVYLGRHCRVLDHRAIKVLPRHKRTDRAIKRFQREAQKAAAIRHVNVVQIHDVGKAGDWHYIVMQYIHGKTLAEVVQQRGPLPAEIALRLLMPLLDALAAIHRQRLIHRDIKPNNIMLWQVSGTRRHTQLVLMDFGLVQELQQDDRLTEEGVVLGTPSYMAPEQARGEPLGSESDIFAVGATLFYVLTGRAPFRGSKRSVYLQVASGPPAPDPADIRPDIPDGLRALVQTAMHPSAALRYRSAEQMLGVVRSLLRRGAHPPPPVTRPIPLDIVWDEAASLGDSPEVTTDAQNSARNATIDYHGAPGIQEAFRGPSGVSGVVAERLRACREKLSAAETGGRPFLTIHRGAVWGVAVAFAVCLVLVLVLVALPRRSESDSGSVRSPMPPTEPPAGMVYIPAGRVHLGASEERLRSHAETLAVLRDSPLLVEAFIRACQEEPHRVVELPGFWIDRYEVTNAEYQRFVDATNHRAPPYWVDGKFPSGKARLPVVQVSYADAAAYAAWANKQLPTIAQWTRAFRGDDDRMYPWGDAWESGRVNDVTNRAFDPGPSPIDATPRDVSPFGVYNLVGNVDEIMRESRNREGRLYMVTKGGHSMCRGAIYGAAPFQFLYSADAVSHELTGFRCVIEETLPP